MNSFVCPLEFRYGRKEMRSIFEEESKLNKMLLVEASLVKALAALGRIPKEDAESIAKVANTSNVKLERVKEIENEIKHDVMAMVKALTEVSGPAGKYVHLGATSSDILDTSTALQFKEGLEILRKDLEELQDALLNLAVKHRKTVMLARTHGQASIPIAFGLKMAVFALDTNRHLQRIEEAKKRILVGKMSGAAGSGASFGREALELQNLVMKDLGLEADEASTQIVGRDRYAELILLLATIASSIEKFATEIRNLQRSGIEEVSESFDVKKQVGSSTMPHKRNPIVVENICGLARLIRGYVHPALENVPLWHERDLTNSSSERFILPHTFILSDDIIVKMSSVFKNLEVNDKKMLENLNNTKGLIMSEAVMLVLVEKGIGRQEAHEILRRCAVESMDKGKEYKDVLVENDVIKKALSEKELDDAFNPYNYLGASEEIIDTALKICKGERKR